MIKKLIGFYTCCLLLLSLNAQNIQASFSYATFLSPEQGPYIETYLTVHGNSVVYEKKAANSYQGTLEITYLFKQNNGIKRFEKYQLNSTPIVHLDSFKTDFIDQQRISIPNGTYDFEISIKDIHDTTAAFTTTQKLEINFPNNKLCISDIELVASVTPSENKGILSKHGFEVLPYSSDFYPETFEKIIFYAEVYRLEQILGPKHDFLVNYYIESASDNQVINNFKGFIREKALPVNVILSSFDIKNLASGNYHLVVEVRNKLNDLLIRKKVFFQRSNQIELISDIDDYDNSFVANIPKKELEEYIKGCAPISSPTEIRFAKNQLNSNDETLMKKYFLNFWISRNPEDPSSEWMSYKKRLEDVNREFSTAILKGYETDRGRVTLKYGSPNTRNQFTTEPLSYPYEIWHYYGIENRTNVKFVFFNRDESTNEYPLLHSNMQGEINNPQWRAQLQRSNRLNNGDDNSVVPYYGEKSDDFFNNPR